MSQLAAQLRILAGGGAATTSSKSGERRSVVASTASLAAIHHATPGSTASKYKASFLFRADVAAATDSATIQSMGCSGMEQLVRLEPRLKSANSALFQSHTFDRESHNTQQLHAIQMQINQCIRLLAPYFMIKPTHKVLEFLIRRYNIHIYNISALLAAFLPYHDSPLFARLVQILQIQLQVNQPGTTIDTENNVNTNKLFGFLEPAQREGTASITRQTLVQRCLHDPAFLQWIIQLVSLKHVAHLSNTTITFYTSMILELLAIVRTSNNANNASQAESIVHVIVMHSVEVLNAHANAGNQPTPVASSKTASAAGHVQNRELFYSTLLILTQISQIHQFNSTLLDSIIFLLCKSLPQPRQDSTLLQPILMTLISFAQTQTIKSIVPKALDALLLSTNEPAAAGQLVRTLISISAQYDVTPLITLLLTQLGEVHQDETKVGTQQLLMEFIGGESAASLTLNENQIRSLVTSLLSGYVEKYESNKESKWHSKGIASLRTLVLLIQERYASALEKVIQELIHKATNKEKHSEEADGEDEDDDEEDKKHKKKKSKKEDRSSKPSNPLLSLIHLLFEGSSQEILDLKTQSTVAHAAGESSVPSAGSILTFLNSPLSHIRIQAIEAVDPLCADAAKLANVSAHLRSTLLSRLHDSEPAVLRALLKVKSLVKLIPSTDLLSALVHILSRVAHTVEPEFINHESGHKIIESVFKVAGKLVDAILENDATIENQAHELYALFHALSPFLFEFALLRPGISTKIANSIHSFMVLLGSKGQKSVDITGEGGNGFDFFTFFVGIDSAVTLLGSDADASAIKNYNDKLIGAFVNSFVRLVSHHAAHPNSTVLATIETELFSILDRTAASISTASQSNKQVGAIQSATPTSSYVLTYFFNQLLTQLSGAAASSSSSKKASSTGSSDAVFIRVMDQFRLVLGRTWSNLTVQQRKESSKSSSATTALLSPASFIHSVSSFTPVSFPAFIRSTFGSLVSILHEFHVKHGAAANQSSYDATLRSFFTFFLGDADSVDVYGVHLALLCKLHLNGGGLQETIRFLLPILQGSTGVSLQVVVRSYHLLHALLANATSSHTKLSKDEQHLVQQLSVTFLLGFASPSRAVRHAVLMATQVLSGVVESTSGDKKGVNGKELKQLLSLVLDEKDEFLSSSNLNESTTALVETATDASLIYLQGFVQKHLSSSSATSPFKADIRVALQQFIVATGIQLSSVSVSAGLRLLQVVRKLSANNVLDLTLPFLQSLLGDVTKSTGAYVDLVVELLQQIDVSVVKADEKHAAFDALIQALSVYPPAEADDDEMVDVNESSSSTPAASRHATLIRRTALGRLSPELFDGLSGAQQEQLFETLLSTLKTTDGVNEIVAELKLDSNVFAKRLVLGGKKKKDSSHLSLVQTILELLQQKDPQRTLHQPFALVAPLFQLLEQLTSLAFAADESAATSQQPIEYAKQLTMAVLMRFIGSEDEVHAADAGAKKSKKSSGASSLSVKDINVNAVVACLGAQSAESAPIAANAADNNTSLHTLNVTLENTRTHALNLLSVIGKRHPELIVDVLIPIFQSLLQQSNEGDEKAAIQARNAITTAMEMDGNEVTHTQLVSDAEPYAFTLLNKLISTVLPSIIQAKLHWNVWQLISVFVESLGTGSAAVSGSKKKKSTDGDNTSVAGRRRLKLFNNLISSLYMPPTEGHEDTEADNYLHVVLALLIAKSVTDKQSKKASSSSSASLDFAHSLSETFSEDPVFQVQAFNNLLALLTEEINTEHAELVSSLQQHVGAKLRLGTSKRTKAAAAKKSPTSESTNIQHLSTVLKSSVQKNAWEKHVISFIMSHLSRLSFAQQIFLYGQRKAKEIEARSNGSEGTEEVGDEEIQHHFLTLFEKLFARLRQSSLLAKHVATQTDEASVVLANHFLALNRVAENCLLALNNLLTMKNFIVILKELFRISQVSESKVDKDFQLILQALNLLNSKLISYKDRQKVQGFANKRIDLDEDEMNAAMDTNELNPELIERRNFHKNRKFEQKLLISLLPALEELLKIEQGHDSSSTNNQDVAAIKQSTLLNLEMLTSSFASMKQFQAEFVKVVPTILGLTLLPKPTEENENEAEIRSVLSSTAWQHISTSALLCLSTLISSFQEKSNILLIEYIPVLIPNTIHILKEINVAKKSTTVEKKSKPVEKVNKKRKHDEDDEQDGDDMDESEDQVEQIQTLDTLVSPLLQLSALSVLQASIVSVPDFLSSYLSDLLQVLLFPGYYNSVSTGAGDVITPASVISASVGESTSSSSVDHSSISTVVAQSLNSLISLIPSRTLLPYIFNHYKTASQQGYSSLRRLFQVLRLIILQFKAENVKLHFKMIFKFFLAAAQQLRKKTLVSGASASQPIPTDAYGVTLNDAEDALISAFLELTLKLNETSFKGLFLKMLQWVGTIPNMTPTTTGGESAAVSADGPASTPEFLSRSLVFFKLIHQFSSKLKGLFVTYFGYILDHCIVFLNAPKTNKNKQKEIESEEEEEDEEEEDENEQSDERSSKKQKQADGSASSLKSAANKAVLNAGISGGVSSELIDLVLLSLRNLMNYDNQHFLDKYHFQLLTNPMVNQLQYAFDTRVKEKSNKEFDDFITHTLAPTIVQMAVRMGNYLQWKPLVSALLIHGRSRVAAVRRAAVYCFEQIFLTIGDTFLTNTPELLPWIAELLEDGDVGVEKNVQKLKKIIEKLSGENLDEALHG